MESGERVFHIKQPALPDFRFEWHPTSKRVYLIRLKVLPLMGDPIAFEITDQGAAINAVLIWTRGYKEAKREQCLQSPAQPSKLASAN